MSADPAATLTPTEALAAAARAGRAAITHLEEGLAAEPGEYRFCMINDAASLATVARGLSSYAAATGKWAAR